MGPALVPARVHADNGNLAARTGVRSPEGGYPLPHPGAHQMRRLASLVSILVLSGGCASAAASPSGPSPSPAGPTVGFALRAWTSQALPPVGRFPNAGPSVAIDQGRLITYGPQIDIFPGPLLPNLQQRPISRAGIDAVVAAARAAGLLDGPTDFTDNLPPGSQTAHLLFVIAGVEREVVGDPTRMIVCVRAPCVAPPGTPEAFGAFWAQVQDIPTWLRGELGNEAPATFDRLAVLLTEPMLDATLPPSVVAWPLAGPMAKFGDEWPGSPPVRCGVIGGPDLAPALAVFKSANQYTRWTDEAHALYGVVARPLFPGEPDPC